eukprot:10637040-Heterocapsa_arctica.AAC.1
MFTLVLSTVAPEEYRSAAACLDLHKSAKGGLRVEPRREIQSQKEKVMWSHVKSNPLPARSDME